MKAFFLNSILLLIITGCTPLSGKKFKKTDPPDTGFTIFPLGSESVFNVDVDFFNNHYSGILVVKNNSVKEQNVVFMSEFGVKIFEVKRELGVFQTPYIIGSFGKKPVSEFQKMLNLLFEASECYDCRFYDNKDYIVKRNDFRQKVYYFQNKEHNRITEISAGKRYVKLSPGGKLPPDTIKISQNIPPVEVQLIRIHQ